MCAGRARGRSDHRRFRVRVGVRLGVDPGEVRTGVARSDPAGVLATPVETITGDHSFDRLLALVRDHEAIEVVVGLPRSLSGTEGPAAATARIFAQKLSRKIAPTAVRLCDERLTTVSAEAVLRDRGRRGRGRRAVVDQVAAVFILQQALDSERATGAAPGEVIEVTHE
jgi:putative holliday junction resolvase